jgi:diguanylate cyclase (GGDEF)-like protein/PAS domain S-box-containing protein
MRMKWQHSILLRYLVVAIVAFALTSVVSVLVMGTLTGARAQQRASERLEQLLDTVESTVRIACFVGDHSLAEEVAQGLLKNSEVQGVRIEAGGHTLASLSRGGVSEGGAPLVREVHSPFNHQQVVGRIVVQPNVREIARNTRNEVDFVALQFSWQVSLLALVLVVVMYQFSVRPIKSMSDRLHRMDPQAGDRLPMPRGHANTEIGRLVDDVNELAGRLVSSLDEERSLRMQREIDERKYHAIFENAETGIFIIAADSLLSSWNPAFARLLELPHVEDYEGTLQLSQLTWENPARLGELVLSCLHHNHARAGDMVLLLKNGGRRWLHLVFNPVGEGLVQGVVHDVTGHKEAEASARRLAITDALTGVANRLGLEERLEYLLRDYRLTQSGGFALLLININDFKRINEGYGMPAGDDVLCTVTSRLSSCIKSIDFLARIAADQFAVLLVNISRGEDVEHIAGRIAFSLRQSYFLDGTPVRLRASMGITLCPLDGDDTPTLMRQAELALDRAKSDGGDTFVFFDPALAEAAEARRHLENDIRLAILRQQFIVFYQPIVDLQAERLAGAEALLRWKHPERGMVPPDAFIPIAEKSGQINEIGLWVLESVCTQLALWQSQGLMRRVSLNVSGRQIPDGLPTGVLADVIERHGIDPGGLALEITEGVLIADLDKALEWLAAVRELGVHIYLDDFGTGYSSLSYLKRLPVDTLKIDKSFVQDMSADSNDYALVEAIVAMARSLGLRVVAEGVELAEQAELLRQMGCSHAQGYLFSRPLPIAEFEAMAAKLGG